MTDRSSTDTPAFDAMAGMPERRLPTILWRGGMLMIVLLVLALAWLVANGELYKAGSTLGYNLGLAGGLMMLALLLYPLRKRVRFMNRLGPMRHWFRLHMLLGIGGPLLILFHSTFRIGSMNARVALYSMLLVACSGIVGRFVYRHIHRGLYGSRMTAEDASAALRQTTDELQATLDRELAIDERFRSFQETAFAPSSGLAAAWRFVTLRWRGQRMARSLRNEIRSALKQAVAAQRLSPAGARMRWGQIKRQLDEYVDATCKAAQFSTWERLFSLWHIVHVPFLYLLLISGIVHVVAVHMY